MRVRKKSFFKKNERPDFYSLLIAQSELGVYTMELFIDFLKEGDKKTAKLIDDTEKEADEVRSRLIDYVENSFITPLDRHDIFAVSRRLDDITDKIKELTDFINFFGFTPSKSCVDIAENIHKTLELLTAALKKWPGGDSDAFWDALTKAKKSNKKSKQFYWESLKEMESGGRPVEEMLIEKEFYHQMSLLSYKTKKAINRISDAKIKTIQ